MRTLVFLISVALLSASFLETAPNRYRILFQGDSEGLVVRSLIRSSGEPRPAMSGLATFMERSDGSPYLSQFGLQKRVLALLLRPGVDLAGRLEGAWIAIGVVTGCVLAWWIAFESVKSGLVAALFLLSLLTLSPWVKIFSTVLYWSSFLLYLPFIVVWTSRPGPAGPPRWLGPVVMALVAVKSLCGYEYLSAVVAGAFVAAVWRDLDAGAAPRAALARASRIAAWGMGGFLVALSIHVAAASAFVGTLRGGVAASLNRAVYRTVGDVLNKPVSLADDAATFLSYFRIEVLPGVDEAQLIAIVAAAAAFVWWSEKGALRVAVAAGVPLALLASLSWNLLALGHMRYHQHINAITFYVPFNAIGFLVIGLAARNLVARIPRPRWRGAAAGSPD